MPKGRNHAIDAGRRRIHRAMRRHSRLPQYLRKINARPSEIQRAVDSVRKAEESAGAPKVVHWSKRDLVKGAKGFARKLFQRKTGG